MTAVSMEASLLTAKVSQFIKTYNSEAPPSNARRKKATSVEEFEFEVSIVCKGNIRTPLNGDTKQIPERVGI